MSNPDEWNDMGGLPQGAWQQQSWWAYNQPPPMNYPPQWGAYPGYQYVPPPGMAQQGFQEPGSSRRSSSRRSSSRVTSRGSTPMRSEEDSGSSPSRSDAPSERPKTRRKTKRASACCRGVDVAAGNMSIYSKEVREAPVPKGFRQPVMEPYDGSRDPDEHVQEFMMHMGLNDFNNAMFCRSFPSTLKGIALAWVSGRKPGSIKSFKALTDAFTTHFSNARRRKKIDDDLYQVKQRVDESLIDYFNRFTEVAAQISNLEPSNARSILKTNLAYGQFKMSVYREEPETYEALRKMIMKEVYAEEALVPEKDKAQQIRWDRGMFSPPSVDDHRDPSVKMFASPAVDVNRDSDVKGARTEKSVASIQDAYAIGKAHGNREGRDGAERSQRSQYSRRSFGGSSSTAHHREEQDPVPSFNRSYSHGANQTKYPNWRLSNMARNQSRATKTDNTAPVPDGTIHTIAGGPTIGGSSNQDRKRYARESHNPPSIFSIAQSSRSHPSIAFTDEDAKGLHLPHADPLVVHIQLGTKMVERVLIDTGASVDVLYVGAYEQLGMSLSMLRPFPGKLVAFSGEEIDVAGVVEMSVTLGTGLARRTENIDLTVVRIPTSYNVILGRVSLMKFQAVVSIYHLKMKFPVGNLVGEVKGRQEEARSCYISSIKVKQPTSVFAIEDASTRYSPGDEQPG